ncbi:MAG: tyrosine-type recombinase/integrase [Acetobacteraceae bacterium]
MKGAPDMVDMRWLRLRGRGYYCEKDVPRRLRTALGGKKCFVRSLQTREHAVALVRRHAMLAEFNRIIAEAERGHVTPGTTAANTWRGIFDGIGRGDPAVAAQWGGYQSGHDNDGERVEWFDDTHAREAFRAEAEAIRAEHGEGAAEEFRGIALGQRTPLLHHADAWLAEGGSKGPLRERTQRQYRADVVAFADWLRGAGIGPFIEAVNRPIVGKFVSEALDRGADRKTLNRKISAVSAYWRWLARRTSVTDNPWSGQSVAKGSAGRGSRYKRPFTDTEVVTLLSGDPDAELADAMRIAALSGMRIEELYRLTVKDCADDWFNVTDAKTAAGIRRVPIHPKLAGIVGRRIKDQPDTAFLFPERGPAKPGRERSMPVSKRFGTYRRGLGIDDRAEGRRQSAVDFHSWRRWFITKARAGFDHATVAAIVGHEVGNITDDTYSGGPDDRRKRRCVGSVKLPEGA